MLLTLIEQVEGGGLGGGAVTALAVARGLAAGQGEQLGAVTFGRQPELTDELGSYGVSTVYAVEHERCAEYAPELWGEALRQLLASVGPGALFAASTDRGNEMMAQAAARAGLPLAANCVAVAPGERGSGGWTVTRLRAGGVLLEDAELDSGRKLVTIAPGAEVPDEAAAAESVTVETFAPEFDGSLVSSTLVDRTEKETGVSLATAPVVVSGGRGVGSAEGFAPLEELAKLLGGAVGCSRVVTNNGWRPHSDQVGLTGTKIAPALYIACGISGATQHWVGCMDAKKILAINTDQEAPMVTRASYAVIGDVQEVLGAVVDEVQRRQS